MTLIYVSTNQPAVLDSDASAASNQLTHIYTTIQTCCFIFSWTPVKYLRLEMSTFLSYYNGEDTKTTVYQVKLSTNSTHIQSL